MIAESEEYANAYDPIKVTEEGSSIEASMVVYENASVWGTYKKIGVRPHERSVMAVPRVFTVLVLLKGQSLYTRQGALRLELKRVTLARQLKVGLGVPFGRDAARFHFN